MTEKRQPRFEPCRVCGQFHPPFVPCTAPPLRPQEPETETEASPEPQDTGSGFEGFCIVEIMGHKRLAGYVREVEIGGSPMLRVDVDVVGGREMTQYYNPAAIYCLTPTTEETVRRLIGMNQDEPVRPWELPAPQEDEDA